MLSTTQPIGTPEAAAFLGVKTNTVKNWRKKRQGPPFVKAGRRVVYLVEDLSAWQNAHRVVPETLTVTATLTSTSTLSEEQNHDPINATLPFGLFGAFGES